MGLPLLLFVLAAAAVGGVGHRGGHVHLAPGAARLALGLVVGCAVARACWSCVLAVVVVRWVYSVFVYSLCIVSVVSVS